MQDNYKIILVVAIVAAVAVVAAVSSTITVQATEKSADEKADSQADKDHTEQADHTCEKAGYSGYFDKDGDGSSDCDFLN
jgi:Ni/Co efflux regulator RcnB